MQRYRFLAEDQSPRVIVVDAETITEACDKAKRRVPPGSVLNYDRILDPDEAPSGKVVIVRHPDEKVDK